MKALMKTTKPATPSTVEKKWHLIDADGLVVGRVAGRHTRPRSDPCRGGESTHSPDDRRRTTVGA